MADTVDADAATTNAADADQPVTIVISSSVSAANDVALSGVPPTDSLSTDSARVPSVAGAGSVASAPSSASLSPPSSSASAQQKLQQHQDPQQTPPLPHHDESKLVHTVQVFTHIGYTYTYMLCAYFICVCITYTHVHVRKPASLQEVLVPVRHHVLHDMDEQQIALRQKEVHACMNMCRISTYTDTST